MKITLTDDNGTYSIEPKECGESLDQIMENLVIPVLKAAGFQQGSIDRYLNGE